MMTLTFSAVTVSLAILVVSVAPVTHSHQGEIYSDRYPVHNTNIPYQQTAQDKKSAKRYARRLARWGMDVDAFLERYGYLTAIPKPHPQSTHHERKHTRQERKEAIRLFQKFHGIKQTSKLNKRTVKMMKEPRCGLPDVDLYDPRSNIRNFHFYHYYPRWRRSVMTWRSSKGTRQISPLLQWKTLKKAFDTWSAVSGLRFLYTRKAQDVNIRFESGNHGDGRVVAFDGEGGRVAHAFGPGAYALSGDIHLDADEDWTMSLDRKDGTNLLSVVIHQIGHSLGLHHSPVPESVMHPSFVSAKFDLDPSDVDSIQKYYGPNPTMSEEGFVLESRKVEVTTPPPKVCKVAMEDFDLGPDGYGYIFKQSFIRKIDKRGKVVKTAGKLSIWDVYPGGPKRIDAVAYLGDRKLTYMFLNNTVWRFTNFKLDYGYPKVAAGRLMPEVPRAAVFIRDQYGVTRLFIFGVSDFWEWDRGRDQVMKGYPLSTSTYFEGMPRAPSAATRWKDGYVYFFKGDKYYKVHPGSYKVMHGYPQPMPPDWMRGVC